MKKYVRAIELLVLGLAALGVGAFGIFARNDFMVWASIALSVVGFFITVFALAAIFEVHAGPGRYPKPPTELP